MDRISITLSLAIATALFASCSNSTDSSTGSLTLPLQTSSASGKVYQLRNATFDISGPAPATLSTAGMNDTNAALSTTLRSGSYMISLRPGWTLYLIDANGPQAVTATLTSASTLSFAIQDNMTTTVGFSFVTQGGAVSFGNGTLDVTISVSETDGGVDGTTPVTFLLNTGRAFSGNGSGSIVSSGGEIDCSGASATCSARFPAGAVVTLTAIPDPGAVFTGWGGDCSGTAATTTVTVSQDSFCEAFFGDPVTFLLTVGSASSGNNGFGGIISSGGQIDCTATGTICNARVAADTIVTLTAVPGPGAVFLGWGSDCSGTAATTTVTMSQDRFCEAFFGDAGALLTVNVNGSGRVSSSPAGIFQCGGPGGDCTESYPLDQVVALTATPGNPLSAFAGWSGACSGPASTVSVTMTQAKSCTATFTGPVTVNFTILGAGSVASGNPPLNCSTGSTGLCSMQSPAGTSEGVQASGQALWSGACSATGTPGLSTDARVDFARDGICTVTFP